MLAYGLVPAWLGAGFADYLCHRYSRIERTSGLRESVMHALQLVEVGVPMLAVLFLEVSGAVVLLMLVAVILHQATAAWDVRYANATRRVSPLEQHVHGVLEMSPIVAAVLVTILNGPRLASTGLDFSWHWRAPGLPPTYLVTVLAGVLLLGVVPYGEELWRTARHEKGRRRGASAAV